MKKIITLIFIFVSSIILAQNNETRTVNNANVPVALYSGIPEISIPLFDINTVNNNFSIGLQLENNLYACTNKLFSTRGIGDGWSLNVMGSITMTPEKDYFQTPLFYDETHYSKLLENNQDKEGHTIYTYSFFGMTGRFVIDKTGSVFKVRILEQNDFADVSVNYTTANNLFRLVSFTVTDKNGFRYIFNHSDKQGVAESGAGASTQYFGEKRTFYLSKVTDKFNSDLLVYNYTGNTPVSPIQNISYNCEFTSIDIPGKGTITLSGLNLYKRILVYKDLKSNIIEKVEFVFFPGFPPFNKILVTDVRIYSNDESKYQSYSISYKRYFDVDQEKHVFGFPHTICAPLDYTKEYLRFDHGAVEKLITPQGGVTFFEYETNTIGYAEKLQLDSRTPGTPTFNQFFNYYQRHIRDNYTFEQIPLTYNASDGGYYLDLSTYVPYDGEHDQIFYIDYKANQFQIFPPSQQFPNGKYYMPTLKVASYTTPDFILPNIDVEQNNCYPGKIIYKNDGNVKFFLKIEPEYLANYQYVRAYYKKYKDVNNMVYYNFSIGTRIKQIKRFSQNVSSINTAEYLVNEQLFKYNIFDQQNTSSGYSRYFNTFSNPRTTAEDNLYKVFDFINTVYKNVTVETPGIGKVTYDYEYGLNNNEISYFPTNTRLLKEMKKYNVDNQLIESLSFERDFLEPTVQLQNEKNKIQPILTYEKGTAQSFENGTSQGYNSTTESTFDPLTRNLSQRKITDPQGEIFQESYTYQKLGNAYYQTQVEKLKNSTPLNRSVFEYQQYGISQAYNLFRTKIAKSTLPLEIEKEITRYDDYGNILEYKTKEGMVVSQIWGYGNSKLVAELKNVSYSDISVTVRNNIANYSNQNGSNYSETSLTTALNSLRASFLNGFITTYTYQPLVGISSVTDANGRKETYEYDSFNRLYRVLNHEGLITKEYSYNIKN